MPAISVVEKFGAIPALDCVLESAEKIEKFPEIRTFFTNYRNPIGIEVEVENCPHPEQSKKMFALWKSHSDGSLKIKGMEFISLPVSGRQVDYALHEMETFLQGKKNLLWSHRTSIHVHQNMSTMYVEQLRAYLMVYGLFEDLFYSMCAPHREGNPYCYRATETDPGQYMTLRESNKYCGLNLYPLKTQCTVEWRQMHGNDDFRLIRRWVQVIMKLHAWANSIPSTRITPYVVSMIHEQQFTALAKRIFGASVALWNEEQIIRSGRRNALWAIQLSDKEFS
jgi:hypothetical protein